MFDEPINPLDLSKIAEAEKRGEYKNKFTRQDSHDSFDGKILAEQGAHAAEIEVDTEEIRKFKIITKIVATKIAHRTLAHQGENPSNWHQAAVYFCLTHRFPKTFPAKKLVVRIIFLGLSYVIILSQIVTASTVLFGVKNRSCGSNNDCEFGTWCRSVTYEAGSFSPFAGTYDISECSGCDNPDMWLKCSKLVNFSPYDDIIEVNATHNERFECEGCFRQVSQEYVTWISVLENNISSMNVGDTITLFLAAMVISLAVSCELRDIKLAEIAQKSRKGKVIWHVMLVILHTLRQYAFLPLLMATIPTLAAYMGSNAIKTCMNTVSVLFMVELDNSAFHYGLREDIRSYVEEYARVVVLPGQLAVMNVMKMVYVVCLPCIIFMSMWQIADQLEHTTSALSQMMVAFFMGGILEILVSHIVGGDPPLEIEIFFPGRFNRITEDVIGIILVGLKSWFCFCLVIFVSPFWSNHYVCMDLGFTGFLQFNSQHAFYWQESCAEL